MPWIVVAIFAVWVGGSLRMPQDRDWAYHQFGRLPVVTGGRTQPFDSLARNSLLQLREKQTANLEPWKEWYDKPKIISASEWVLGVMMKSEEADQWPVFRIDNPDVKSLLSLPADPEPVKKSDGKHYSWAQIQPKLADLRREATRASKVDPSKRQPYDQALLKLWNGQQVYRHLKVALGPAGRGDLDNALKPYQDNVEAGRTAYFAQTEKRAFDEAALDWLVDQTETPLIVPMANASGAKDLQWKRVLQSVIETSNSNSPVDFSIQEYNRMARAYRAGNAGEFNAAVNEYQTKLVENFTPALKEARSEQLFNTIEPFYKAMVLDVCAFLFVLGYWFKPKQWDYLRKTAVAVVLLALVVHTSGLIFRIVLQGRPPVTNLYSSAIFIGWGATILGLVLERFWRNSIGVAVSAIIGFLTLIIAHHLSFGGDTMEMMRAVLDTNFWLATHVVVVTLGYASTFVAGFLAIIYIVLGVFTKVLNADMRKSLNRMIYGIICFAALFSFVGTVLGGIWADQSWGRFWGWDPKENGALIIVLWNALILHARWGGMVKERGLANMALVGNIVTSWSWFGVNMLGIGLHSYGFTDAAFRWLMTFVFSQLVLIGLGLLPRQMWKSFREEENSGAPPTSGKRKKEMASATS
ncbi:cytochrome c assembly protein [Pedosphaera parvula Ellin514]|uniref:Cytochrome c assembly protein n=2 Tax=Pedosphaera TaxID=1032526 RepID=B9XPF9_PEDPL|nr:cytochrome c assembly protein [Pedosphaera parvula Ellin514]